MTSAERGIQSGLARRFFEWVHSFLDLCPSGEFNPRYATANLFGSPVLVWDHRRRAHRASLAVWAVAAAASTTASDLWALAQENASTHRFSTLFTAQDVRDRLSKPEGLSNAVAWCKASAVTHVYIESFRDGYQAERAVLLNAKQHFATQGFIVSGCITPTRLGKTSTGWNLISCYTDRSTQEKVKQVFTYTAAIFDEIMIDDFWFTDCACSQCDQARGARKVDVLGKEFAAPGDSWADYRCELMVRISQDLVIKASKDINPKAVLIIKFPQWYDRFHERGYDVLQETRDFDKTWVGTETRDFTDARWGGTPQYEAYFIMRWLGRMGGEKCGGGWFDPYGTTRATYVEQARQTILADARESLLFCYGSLLKDTGPDNVATLRQNIPELFRVAGQVKNRQVIGIAAYKPANSAPGKETRIFDFVGMLGLPLVPCHQFPETAQAAFFSYHALKDTNLVSQLSRFINTGRPVLITDGLAEALKGNAILNATNVHVLVVKGDPKSLLTLDSSALEPIRKWMLQPFGTEFDSPNRVGLYLFRDGSWVVENFNDEPAVVRLNGVERSIASRGWEYQWK